MAFDYNAIRAALAAQIKNGVNREVNVYDGFVPSTPTPPAIIVFPGTEAVRYEQTFHRPQCTVEFELWVLANPGGGVDGQRLMGEFMSSGTGQTNSLRDAIAADKTLNGTVDSAFIDSAEYRGRFESGRPDSQVSLDWAVFILTATKLAN